MRNITPSFQTWHSGQPKFSTPFPYLREQPDGESKLLHPCMLEAAAEANIRLKGTSAESPQRGEHPTAIPVLRVGPCMGTEHTVDGASAPTIPGLSPSFKIFKIFVQKNKKKADNSQMLSWTHFSLTAASSQHFSVGFGRKPLGFDSCSFLGDKLTSPTKFCVGLVVGFLFFFLLFF